MANMAVWAVRQSVIKSVGTGGKGAGRTRNK